MESFSTNQLKKVLSELDIKKSDNIFVLPELFRLGKLDKVYDSKKYYSTILDCIIKKVGPTGSIFFNSYTFDRSRLNKNFIVESTSSTSGAMSNLFLKKRIIRSEHPLFSVAGLGKKSKEVCKDNSIHNYGCQSPFYKMMSLKTKILCLGPEMSRNPFLHMAEYFMGVPYCYNKIFKKNVIKNKKVIKKNFVTFVRYLDLKYEYDFKKLEKILKSQKIMKQKKIGSGYISVCDASLYFDHICNILSKNIHGLLVKKPNYKFDKYPYS